MGHTRRSFFEMFCCAVCSAALGEPVRADMPARHGCEVLPEELQRFGVSASRPSYRDGDAFETLRRSSGDHQIDVLLDRALKKLSDVFGVAPGFGFFDDGEAPNAWATARSLIPGTTGTVAFGQSYFKKWMAFDPSGLCVLATCAHEFGHIMQYQSGRYQEIKGALPTSKRIELHADYMSGYYMGLLKRERPEASFWRAGDKFRQIGSFDEKDANFHGTPAERVAASQQGFNVGFYEDRDAKFAFRSGADYVSLR
jgi:hypothetical protein